MNIQKISLHTYMDDYGQMADEIRISGSGLPEDPALKPEDFKAEGCFGDVGASIPTAGITAVHRDGEELILKAEPFLYRADFRITAEIGGEELVIDKAHVTEVKLHHEEMFRAVNEDGLVYRLYEPQASGKRPLILFLHGGGGCGTDNVLPLVDTLGAIKLAERVPEMYVLAPQAPAGNVSMEEMMARLAKGNGDHFKVIIRNDVENGPEARGWTRPYLARVIDLIRKMVAEGKVDPERIYVTGLSMGGCGTLKAVATAPDLFAACVPICPSMNGETYPILENFPEVPTWIATSYIDHQVARHAYIMRAVQKLWDKGRRDVRFTIFTPEELAEYGIGTAENLSAKDLYAQNHNSWILVYHNEYGILDWMFTQRKKS